MSDFLLQPDVYRTGPRKNLLGVLEDTWIHNRTLGEGDFYLLSYERHGRSCHCPAHSAGQRRRRYPRPLDIRRSRRSPRSSAKHVFRRLGSGPVGLSRPRRSRRPRRSGPRRCRSHHRMPQPELDLATAQSHQKPLGAIPGAFLRLGVIALMIPP